MGGYAAYLLLAFMSRGQPLAIVAATRVDIERVCSWMLIPSMACVLMSGLFSIAVHPPFQKATWVWVKTASGLAIFEGTFGLQSHARTVSQLAQQALSGDVDVAQLADQLKSERYALWFFLFIAVGNVVIGVWRPRFGRVVDKPS